jgi:hypothetical protein
MCWPWPGFTDNRRFFKNLLLSRVRVEWLAFFDAEETELAQGSVDPAP